MEVNLKGFHGTDKANVSSILDEGFIPSKGDKHWLGDGSYFFLEGLNRFPENQAKQWAIVEAWDSKTKSNRYLSYAVIECSIQTDDEHFLDLTKPEGIEILDYIQEQCYSKLKGLRNERIQYVEGFLINFARIKNLCPIDVAKGNFYIKLKPEDRKLKNVSWRTANSTICAVFSSKKNITNMNIVKEGDFSNETK